MKKLLFFWTVVLLILSACGCSTVMHTTTQKELVVVIDAGHGGIDPGVIGITGSIEKELNLEVAKELKVCFEEKGVKVIMTRNDGNGLYDESDKNKKQADMKRRGEIIAQSNASALISIHMNAIADKRCKGTQVFYQKGTSDSFAVAVQSAVVSHLQPDNHRLAHPGDYYVLRAGAMPSIIVECGFLSNTVDEALLCDGEYRKKLAWCICVGAMEYLTKTVA